LIRRARRADRKLKTAPGVAAAGWTSGTYDMERAIRFAAGEWSENGKLNRDKFASMLAGIASKVMGAKPASSVE
jgi:hypothetical protein